MLKTAIVPAINEKTREYLNSYLDRNFNVKHSDNPEFIISEVLNDRDLNLFLFSYLPQGKGVYLGSTEYFDQPARIYVHYGLTIDFENTFNRKTQLFLRQSFENFPAYIEVGKSNLNRELELMHYFPREEHYFRGISHENFQGWPTLNEFLEQVNLAFSSNEEFKKRVYPLKFS